MQMTKKAKWIRIIFLIGVFLLVIGAFDPLEGSIVIITGSFLLALSAFASHDKNRMLFLVFLVLMAVGIFFLFYISSLGGLGANALSWWWGITILPYPVAWIATIILLIIRAFKKTKQ